MRVANLINGIFAVISLCISQFAFSHAFVVSHTTINTVENGLTATYKIALDQAPSAGETVTVTPASGDVTEGTVSGALMFDNTNWDTAQTVTITPGATGDGNDGDVMYTITNSVTSVGGATDFAGVLASSVNVTNQNIDGVSVITVQPSSGSILSIDEGSSVTVTVAAVGGPAADVTIGISTGSSEITLSTPTLTLNAANGFSTTVSIAAIADAVVDADEAFTVVTTASSSADHSFNGFDPVDIVGIAVNADEEMVEVVAPNVLQPADLAPGDTFFVAFVASTFVDHCADTTSGTPPTPMEIAATSVASIENHGTDAAMSGSKTSGVTGWQSLYVHSDGIVTTNTVQAGRAFKNITNRPIYNTRLERIANDRNDLFDGSGGPAFPGSTPLINFLNYDENGDQFTDGNFAFTGYGPLGDNVGITGEIEDSSGNPNIRPLGARPGLTGCTVGDPDTTNANAFGAGNSAASRSIYVLSPLLQMPGDDDACAVISGSNNKPFLLCF